MLKGILFDYSGTIVAGGGYSVESGFRSVFDHVRFPKGVCRDAVLEYAVDLELEFQDMRDQTALEFSFGKLLRIVIDYFCLKTDHSIIELEAMYYENAVHYLAADGVARFLMAAADDGIRLGVISNCTNSSKHLGRQLRNCGISDYFSFIISSADYGIRKQHPLLFEIGLARLHLHKNEVVYIGDNLAFDIATAQRAGLRAIWYNPQKKPGNEIVPDFIFEQWGNISYKSFVPLVS